MQNIESELPARESSETPSYLTDEFPSAKPYEDHKRTSEAVSDLYLYTPLYNLSFRMMGCSTLLEFVHREEQGTHEPRLEFKSAQFCRCRQCTVCQSRRAKMWRSRMLRALPKIREDYPTIRFVFLTLTVQNCELSELRATLKEMNRAFTNMKNRKDFPALGWVRAAEVTRAADDKAHPHFHCLLAVKPSYFNGREYLSQADWTEMWKSALKVSYTPVVNVKAVRPGKRWLKGQEEGFQETFSNPEDAAFASAVTEVFKYTLKPTDYVKGDTQQDRAWLVELTGQLHKTRAVAIGGILKGYLSEQEPDENEEEEEQETPDDGSPVFFGWRAREKRYARGKAVCD